MGRIQQCVRDVLHIANKTEDFGQARKRIEQLFVGSKGHYRGYLAVAQRVRDQINQDTTMSHWMLSHAWTVCSNGQIVNICSITQIDVRATPSKLVTRFSPQ